MIRIVGGIAKGRRLAVPAEGTRPTSDRAREAMFNTLRSLLDIEGARALDLFAGSGAVGLEALSRGASAVTFVESGRAAVETLRRNIAAVGLPGADVVRRPVASALAGEATPADLVFADPPYALPERSLTELLARLVAGGWLAADAVVVVERSAIGVEPTWPEGVAPVMKRRYGQGVLWYGRPR